MERSCRNCSIVDVFSRTLASKRRAFCSAFAFTVASYLFQARVPQETSPRTSQLGLEFVTVLLGLLQLIFDVVHILGLTSIDESKHIHNHNHRFSALQFSNNLSNLALQAVLFSGHLSETHPFCLQFCFKISDDLFRLLSLLQTKRRELLHRSTR